MKDKITRYRFSAPHVFTGEMILTYKNGYLNGIEGVSFIGPKWNSMCINKALPFRESDIISKKEEHANKIYFKQMREINSISSKSAASEIRRNGIL